MIRVSLAAIFTCLYLLLIVFHDPHPDTAEQIAFAETLRIVTLWIGIAAVLMWALAIGQFLQRCYDEWSRGRYPRKKAPEVNRPTLAQSELPSLTNCPHCKRTVSLRSVECPKCGQLLQFQTGSEK